jgi:hypothetical protein
LAFLVLSASAHAQSPREQLNQMVEQLQKSPADNVLREKIIKLAGETKPAPAVPEEANRAFVRGNVFQKEAKDTSGYELAIAAYRDALRVAPWWGDAYYNLAVALESARKFDEAISSIKLYMTSLPTGGAEVREAQNRIYAIEAKSEMAAKQAAISARPQQEAEKERLRPTVEGKWSLMGFMTFQITRNGDRFTIVAGDMMGRPGLWRATDAVIDRQHVRFTAEQPACPQCRSSYDLTLGPGGNELAGTIWKASSGTKEPAAGITRVP